MRACRPLAVVAVVCLSATAGNAATTVLQAGHDPQLFLDDYMIARSEGLTRTVHQPQKLPNPVLDSATYGTTQPYLSVLYDEDMQRYRMWYCRGPAIWHVDSADGIRWENPRVAWDLPRAYGASLIDDDGREKDPNRRYKCVTWQNVRAVEDTPQDLGGMYVGFSPDGFNWTPHEGNPVLRTWPEGYGNPSRYGVGDISDVFWDPIRKRYAVAVKVHALAEDGWAPGPKAGGAFRRLVGMTISSDFVHWRKPWRIFVPDGQDEGLMEFYGMGGTHARGALLIGFVRMLRDDLPCDPDGPADGIGYSVLATSRDGINWHRYREPFLDRNHEPGTWDHAMAWISGVVPVGDEVFIYYGGYARGHKIEPQKERQIGMARLRKDGYVSLDAGPEGGWLVTPVLMFQGKRLELNVDVGPGGAARVEIQDTNGTPIPGFRLMECDAITADSVAHRVTWKGKGEVSSHARTVARVKVALRCAKLYGFRFAAEPE